MNKKKLIIFMPFIGGGGVEKNLFLISNYLHNKINNLIVCTSSRSKRGKFNNKINFLFTKKEFSEETNIRIKYLFCLFVLFKYLIKNRNCVVLSFQANIYCIIICKIMGVKIIVRSNSSPSGWYHNFLKKNIYRMIITLADEVIVNSSDFKKQMKNRFKLNVKCIFNPLNKREIIEKSKEALSEEFFNVKKKCLKILNIGRLTEQKNQITLLRTAKILKKKLNFRLLIFGRGIEKIKLQKFISKNNLKKHVRLRDFINNPYPIIKKTDIFILSSKYEGLPNVLLEAATLKKLIFSTNCPTGPREILSNGKGGVLFKVGDYKELVKKIYSFSKNRNKFKSKVIYAYNHLDRYNFDRNLNKYFLAIKPYLS